MPTSASLSDRMKEWEHSITDVLAKHVPLPPSPVTGHACTACKAVVPSSTLGGDS